MSGHTARVRAGNDRASLYTEITDEIIAELEAGRIPWVQPWGTAAIKAPLAMPRNAATQRGYAGINVLILWGSVIDHGFSGQSWLTFRQALGLGGHVRKGERGTTVVYADRFTPDDERRRAAEAGEEPGAIPFLKRFTVFITGIRSDLPGQITAHVTENIFDTPTGRWLLVPQGARLVGIYDSQVTFGQSRVLLVWTRLIMPNGRSIVLERQPGADTGGYAGLQDEVDHHGGELFRAALLSTLLGVGAELGSGSDAGNGNSAILQALRRGAGDSLNQTGQQVVRRNLNIQPTLTIRPGFPVRVIVNRDLVLEPYRG
jgi:hypothetical protein